MKKNWIKILIYIFLIGAVIWAGKGIFKYSVFSTHDGNHHISRVYDAIQSIKEGEFPLRWAGSLNYFCGAPIYNFFYPLIYYLTIAINLLTNNVIFTLKIINFGSLLLGTVFFYLWIKSETEKELPAIGGALTYLYAPYRFSLIFVRGSPEFLAYAILPVVLYLYSLLFKSSGKKFLIFAFLASLSGAFLAISHNFTVMFLMPIILVYLIIKIYLNKVVLDKILWIAFSFLGSFGMSAFFIGPAVLEQKFTKIGHNFLEWRDHFPTFWQTVKSNWGYFYSASGTANDGMSFMLGYIQWVILGLGSLFLIIALVRSKFKFWKYVKENIFVIFFFLLSILSIYLILPVSIPVWEKIRPLQEIQFSWRLLGIAVFTISALFSFILAKIKSKYVYVALFIVASLGAIVGTRNFMLPQPVSVEDIGKYSDYERLHPHRHSTTTMGDDVLSPNAEKSCWFSTKPLSTEKDEDISFSVVERGNTFGSIKFLFDKNKVTGDKIVFNLGYFPEIYNISLNGSSPIPYADCGGQVCFDKSLAKAGDNFVSWKIGQSRTEIFFNYITIGFFALWVLILLIKLFGIDKSKKNLTLSIIGILIFLIFLFFRSYNLPGRIGFGWDQERDAVAISGILKGKLTLLGPRVQGDHGFFLPPYFFYIAAPFYFIFKGSPIATAGFIIFWSILFFAVTYFVLAKIFSRRTALMFLALWAVNPLAISIDTIAWNPVTIPFFLLILIYLNYLYLKNHKLRHMFLAGLVFGIGTSFHLQFLFTAPILIPTIIDALRRKEVKSIILMIAASVTAFMPIFVFDIRHNFLNFHQLLPFIRGAETGVNRVWVVWEKVSAFMVGGHPSRILGLLVFMGVLTGYFVLIAKTKSEALKKVLWGLVAVWALSIPLFNFLIKNPSEYYFNFMLIPLITLISLTINKLKKLGYVILLILVIYFTFPSRPLLRDVALSLTEKMQAVSFLGQITKNSNAFNLSFDAPFNEDTGFRYLLSYYNVKYSNNPKDPLIEFVIPSQKRETTFVLGKIGIFIPPGWMKNNWLAGAK